ncbi:Uncharacterised protein [Vibrio cholerae]|nr:Uncharacterised protein [Vibrio cholerae]
MQSKQLNRDLIHWPIVSGLCSHFSLQSAAELTG